MSIKGYNSEDPYTYSGSFILKNKLNLKTESELDKAERRLYGLQELTKPSRIEIELNSFLDLHKHLFGTLYTWAGEIRQVPLSKGGTPFCNHQFIEKHLQKCLNQLCSINIQSLDTEALAKFLAPIINELNMIHPFREGNGRHLRSFLEIYLNQNNHSIDFSKIRHREPDDWVSACIAGATCNHIPMQKLLERAIKRNS